MGEKQEQYQPDRNDPTGQSGERQPLLDSNSFTSIKTDRIIKPTRCNGCTVIIEPIMFIFMLSLYPVEILMPQFYQRNEWKKLMGDIPYPATTESCKLNQTGPSAAFDPIQSNLTLASSRASLFGLQTSLTLAVPAFISVLFLGPYSDMAGRRYALILPIAGQTFLTFTIFITSYFRLPLEVLFIGFFVFGCCGYWVTLLMGAIAYVSDITTKEQRSFRIVVMETCIFAPVMISSTGSGFMLQTLGFTWVFLIVFASNALVLLYVVFFIPDTIEEHPGAKFFSLKYMKKAFTVFAFHDGTKRRWKLLMLVFIFFLYLSVIQVDVQTYFEMNLPLCWNSVIIGIYAAVAIGVSVIGSALLTRILGLCLADAWIAVLAMVLSTSMNAYKYFVTTTAMMFGSAAFNIMGIVAVPTIRSMMSKIVQPNEVGAALSVLALIQILCKLVGSVTLNPVYAVTAQAGQPSAVFLLQASVYFIAFLLMLSYAIFTRKEAKGREEVVEVHAEA